MKKIYTTPGCELILLENTDIVTTSGFETDENGNIDLPFIPW